MEDYASNSIKSKQSDLPAVTEKPVIEKVITTKAEARKKGVMSRFVDNFIQTDARTVRNKIVEDVVEPSLKNLIFDSITNALRMFLFKDSGPTTTSQSSMFSRISFGGQTNKTPYNSIFKSGKPQPVQKTETAEVYDFGEVIVGIPISEGGNVVENRKAAEVVLKRMDEICNSRFNQASVADLLQCVGLDTQSTDFNWGWTSFGEAKAQRLNDGRFLIKTPKAELLQTQ
ncbi:MAG: hypothetical protein J6U54_11340 [Clostridiales bacterium]|nr:hypothetical protein [Clostridiales bacterium]